MAQLMPYVDKENGLHSGVSAYTKNQSHRRVSGIAGKVFSNQIMPLKQKTTDKTLGGALTMKTTSQTRKALSDINRISSMCLEPPTPASKCTRLDDCQPDDHKKWVQNCNKLVSTIQQAKPETEADDYDEIEQIPEYKFEEDNFADIWDPSERPDSYTSELLNSRPTCLYPYRHVDLEDTDRDGSLLENDLDSSLEDFRIKDVTLEEADIELEPDVRYEYVLLPPSDDICSVTLTPGSA